MIKRIHLEELIKLTLWTEEHYNIPLVLGNTN
jgi:hypothetical protein